ncbi:hypothetical protein [Traorella massiliensis]|uniref:hypothetical protein n=1 Tax=Traorella massiliensis TaxID=1903263 RepID=UPI0008F9699D|nr:hypothetical protein [Traorella massiliensis]
MKLSKLFKGILCASLFMGGMAIMPNKTDAVEIEPYAIVREIKVNRREKADVQLPGLDKQFVYVDFSGSYILATNPNGIQNWQVSVSLPDGVSHPTGGAGYYEVTLLDYDYSYRTGGAKVTLYLKVQYTHNYKQSAQVVATVNI